MESKIFNIKQMQHADSNSVSQCNQTMLINSTNNTSQLNIMSLTLNAYHRRVHLSSIVGRTVNKMSLTLNAWGVVEYIFHLQSAELASRLMSSAVGSYSSFICLA